MVEQKCRIAVSSSWLHACSATMASSRHDICHHHLFLSPSVGTERLINPEMLPAWQPLCPTSPAFHICIEQHRRARSPNRGFHMADPLQSARSPDNLALRALDEKGRLLFLEEGSGYSARKNSRRSHISEKKCGVEMHANSTT